MRRHTQLKTLIAAVLLPLLAACPGKKQVEDVRHHAETAASAVETQDSVQGGVKDGVEQLDSETKGLAKDRKKIPSSPVKKTKTGVALKPETHKIDPVIPADTPVPDGVSVVVVEGTLQEATAVIQATATPETVPLTELGTVDLKPNTEYQLALLPEEGGAVLETVTVVTLADEPSIEAAMPVGQGDVLVTIDTKDNPPDTEYLLAALPGGNADEPIYVDVQTGQVVPPGESPEAHPLPVAEGAVDVTPDVTIVNLPGEANDYTYVVQAENGEGEATDWSDPVSVPGGVDSDVESENADEDLWADSNLSPEDAADVDVISADDVQSNQLSGLKDEIKKLRARLKELSAGAKVARAELKSAQEWSRKVLKEIKRIKRDGKGSKDELRAAEAEYNKALAAVAAADKALGTSKQDRKSLRELIKARLKEFKELKQQIMASHEDVKDDKKPEKPEKPEKKVK